uniref:hypothetical protein n=1 Tax=Salmonella enterica TaxID=28901 RepID=UPI003298E64C
MIDLLKRDSRQWSEREGGRRNDGGRWWHWQSPRRVSSGLLSLHLILHSFYSLSLNWLAMDFFNFRCY